MQFHHTKLSYDNFGLVHRNFSSLSRSYVIPDIGVYLNKLGEPSLHPMHMLASESSWPILEHWRKKSVSWLLPSLYSVQGLDALPAILHTWLSPSAQHCCLIACWRFPGPTDRQDLRFFPQPSPLHHWAMALSRRSLYGWNTWSQAGGWPEFLFIGFYVCPIFTAHIFWWLFFGIRLNTPCLSPSSFMEIAALGTDLNGGNSTGVHYSSSPPAMQPCS